MSTRWVSRGRSRISAGLLGGAFLSLTLLVGPWGGYRVFARTPGYRRHPGTWLQVEGYRTALIGKFLNGYERDRTVQSGWTSWNALLSGVFR